MQSVNIRQWCADVDGDLTQRNIERLHQPREHFHITHSRYSENVKFQFASITGFRYILSGSCAIKNETVQWQLNTGDVIELPSGEYGFQAGDTGVEYVAVWKLPFTAENEEK